MGARNCFMTYSVSSKKKKKRKRRAKIKDLKVSVDYRKTDIDNKKYVCACGGIHPLPTKNDKNKLNLLQKWFLLV